MRRAYTGISLALVFALILLSFVGCASSKPASSAEKKAATSQPEANNSTASSQVVENSDNLSGNLLWLNSSGEEASNQWQDLMVEQFTQVNPDVTIEIQRMSFDNYVTTLQTKIASGDAPDIFATEGEQMRTFHENGYLADLSGEDFVVNFLPENLANVTLNGQLIAIPTDTGSMCVTYNKDTFASAGIEKVPATLDEFYAACEKLKAVGIEPIAAGFKETWCLMADMQSDYITSVLGKDANAILSLLNREDTFVDSPLWKDEFTRLFSRFQYVSSDPFGTDWSGAGDMVATGKAAMVLNGTWAIANIREKNADVPLGVFALPFTNDATDTKLLMQAPQSGTAVYSSSENIEVAKAFVGYTVTPTSGTALAQMAQKMSIVIGAESPEEPAWEDIYAYIENGNTFNQGAIDHNFPNEYRVAVETMVSKHLLSSEKSVDALLAELDAEFDRIADSNS